MQDLYGQYNRGPALMPRKRGLGTGVVLASGATAIALAGFFVVAALGRHEPEPLPPRSTPLEVAKAPTEAVTGSLPPALQPTASPKVPASTPLASVAASPPPPAPEAPAAAPPPAAPAPATGITPLIQAQPKPPAPAAPAAVVASAEIVTTLPSPIPPLTAPVTPPIAVAPPPQPAPAPVTVAPAPKPRVGPSQGEITALTNRARELIKSGDIAGARLLLERAASGEDGPSLLALAETYDPAVLSRWGVVGMRPDVEKARGLYQKAAERGTAGARERLSALR